MAPEESNIVEKIATAVANLNAAIGIAYEAGLDVSIEQIQSQQVNRRGSRPIVNALVSKTDFEKRV